MIPGLFFLILLFSFILIKSADQVVIALKFFSKSSGKKAYIISALLLAVATSFPELFVGITSALEGSPILSFGNVLGANVTNISLVAGLSALFIGRVSVHGSFLKHDVGIALIAGIIPLLLSLDSKISRVDGLVLLACYGAYATSFFRLRFLQIAELHKQEGFWHRLVRRIARTEINGNLGKELGRLFIGVALLLLSADVIVKIAEELGKAANIPLFIVGLVILSVGTTLPELAFSFRALEDDQPQMYFGNLLGSIIANSTLIVGITSLIHPIEVASRTKYFPSVIIFFVIFLTFWFFIKSKMRLDRWEAFFLLALYVIFVVVEFV